MNPESPEPEKSPEVSEENESIALKNWTAQDFANIYVQYYPLVLAHARKFVGNQTQAEEITQDAFFYLITSLPEVDSELGVLRLLKWKAKMLAYDILRYQSRSAPLPIDFEQSFASEQEQPSDAVIRADEASIVYQALAKIPPRQRQALIMSVYEEKTSEQLAKSLEVSPNAARQLLYKAKRSFRRAFVGEAETEGMSVSKILSVAARKAASDARFVATAASALVLAIALPASLSFSPGVDAETEPEIVAQQPSPTPFLAEPEPEAVPPDETKSIDIDSKPDTEPNPVETAVSQNSAVVEQTQQISPTEQVVSESFESRLTTLEIGDLLGGLQSSSLSLGQDKHPLGTPQGSIPLKFELHEDLMIYVNFNPSDNSLNLPVAMVSIQQQNLMGIPKITSLGTSSTTEETIAINLSIQDFYSIQDDQEIPDTWITDASSQIRVVASANTNRIISGEAYIKG